MKKNVLILLFLSITLFFAPLNLPAEVLKTDSDTKTYVVVKGDTLWSITGKFYKDPFRWPDLWKINRQVENPHLIFPGDTLRIDPDGFMVVKRKAPDDVIIDEPEIIIQEDDIIVPDTVIVDITEDRPDDVDLDLIDIAPGDDPDSLPITELLEPTDPDDLKIIKLATATGDELEKPSIQLPKFVNSSIRTKKEIKRDLEPIAAIVEGEERETILSAGMLVLIYFKDLEAVKVGDKFTAYTIDGKVKHPVTRKKVGYIVNNVAALEIIEVNEEVATAKIFQSYEEVFDVEHAKIIPYVETFDKVYLTNATAVIPEANIIKGFDETDNFAVNYFAYIDKGTDDGLADGNVLQIFRKRSMSANPFKTTEFKKMPDIDLGRAIIVKAHEKTSLIMVIRTFRDMSKKDLIRTTGIVDVLAPEEDAMIAEVVDEDTTDIATDETEEAEDDFSEIEE